VAATGGVFDQPVGGVPVFVVKLQDPPVGVAGTVADSMNMKYSKYVPPKLVVLPYKPADSDVGEATVFPAVLFP
jgi:uncharacterized protein YndB with AHSA1/START domain